MPDFGIVMAPFIVLGGINNFLIDSNTVAISVITGSLFKGGFRLVKSLAKGSCLPPEADCMPRLREYQAQKLLVAD